MQLGHDTFLFLKIWLEIWIIDSYVSELKDDRNLYARASYLRMSLW